MGRDVERIDRIGQALGGARLDGLVCALPANVLMVSGYWPVVGTSIAAATAEGVVFLLVPEDEKELASHAGADEVRTFRAGSLEDLRTAMEAVSAPFREMFRVMGLDRGTVGCEGAPMFEPASYAGMHLYNAGIFELLSEALTAGSPADATDLLERLRSVKTPIEIDRIRRACRIAGEAFAEATPQLRPGLKETEAAANFARPLSVKGTGYEGVERAHGFCFAMSGPNSGNAYGAYARSRAREIEVADLVLTHCNSVADGYWTDITRTYCMGPPDDRQAEVYDVIFAARAAALRGVAPRARACEVDRAARGVIERRGFGSQFRHPAGHGVGFAAIDHHARPRVHPEVSGPARSRHGFQRRAGNLHRGLGRREAL